MKWIWSISDSVHWYSSAILSSQASMGRHMLLSHWPSSSHFSARHCAQSRRRFWKSVGARPFEDEYFASYLINFWGRAHCKFSGFSFTFLSLVYFSKVTDQFHDGGKKKIVKWQKSRSECCDLTKKFQTDSNFLAEFLNMILNPNLWCQFVWKSI